MQKERSILKEENGIVLAKFGNEFVTWARGYKPNTFVWGHYFSPCYVGEEKALEEATKDFNERVKRNF